MTEEQARELAQQLQAALSADYRITEELGAGGMSRVFVAVDQHLGREVVVKVLPPDLGVGLNTDRFKREIQMAARLQHPHIVPLLSAAAKNGLLYYTMPRIEGETLRARLQRTGALPMPDAVRIMRDVADALEYAHAHGLVHRDIKPENILLSGHHALVTDFGVAKALSAATGQSNLTSVGVTLGTPTYMSPEQASADPMVDHRSDLYALGVVGYEMLAGQPPFAGTSHQQVLVKQVTEQPVPITQIRGNLPPALANIVMRCLEKQPADRFQKADDVREALESVGATSRSTTVLYGRPSAPSKKILVFAGVAAVLLLASLIASRYLNGNRSEFEGGATTQVTHDPGVEITPALSPDGKLLAYAGGQPTNTSIFVRQVSGGDPIRLAIGRAPQWSADGTRLVYVDSMGISSVPALGGQPQRLVYRPGTSQRSIGVENIATSPAWSHDGRSLAYAASDTIWIANADGSEPHVLTATREPHSISWSPDNRRLAYVRGNSAFVYAAGQFGNIAPSSVWIINRDGTGETAVTDSIHQGVSPVWTTDGEGLLYVSNIRGGIDLYYQRVRGNRPEGVPQRLTTGLKIHSIAVGADRVAYSLWNTSVGMWAVTMPASGATSTGAARQITSASERIEAMNPSPDGQWLAFDSDRSGNSDIYKMRIDGTGLQQLTRDPADDFRPQWSPDGRYIGYHSWRTGNRDSYVMSSDGSNQRLIAGGPGHEFGAGFSPDGKQLVFWTDHTGRFEICTVPFEGGSLRQLTHNGGWMPNWSKDGKWIAYLGIDQTLRLIPAAGGPEKILVTPKAFGPVVAVGGWSADSRKIYFRLQRPDGSLDIAQVALDGTNPSIVVHFDDHDRPAYRPDFSSDGKNFYFSVGHHEADVWVMDLRKK